ncbi:unnamed protein product [Ixodes persulcatus]
MSVTHRLGRFMVVEGALVILGNGYEAPTPKNARKADQPAQKGVLGQPLHNHTGL